MVDEQVQRNGLLAGCFATVITQGMCQRLKANEANAHEVTDVHANMSNLASVFFFFFFHLPCYILFVPIVLVSFLLGWYVGLRQKSVTPGGS